MIYLLPWTKEKDNFEMIVLYHRKELGTNKIFATIEYNMAAGKWTLNAHEWARNGQDFYSFEEATKFIDTILLSQLKRKFYLITKNDMKRFEEKLIVLL